MTSDDETTDEIEVDDNDEMTLVVRRYASGRDYSMTRDDINCGARFEDMLAVDDLNEAYTEATFVLPLTRPLPAGEARRVPDEAVASSAPA